MSGRCDCGFPDPAEATNISTTRPPGTPGVTGAIVLSDSGSDRWEPFSDFDISPVLDGSDLEDAVLDFSFYDLTEPVRFGDTDSDA